MWLAFDFKFLWTSLYIINIYLKCHDFLIDHRGNEARNVNQNFNFNSANARIIASSINGLYRSNEKSSIDNWLGSTQASKSTISLNLPSEEKIHNIKNWSTMIGNEEPKYKVSSNISYKANLRKNSSWLETRK